MTSEMLRMRSGKKASENMLFYNLDTPDLIGNKYTHNSLEKSDAAFNGEVGMGAQGCGGLARLRRVLQGSATEQRCLGGCVECWVIQKQKGSSPVFPIFFPSCCSGLWCDARQAMLLALVRRWTWSAVLGKGGFGGSSALGGLQDPKQSLPYPPCHDPTAVAPPEHEALALTPCCTQIPWPRWVSRVLGGDAVPPTTTTASRGARAPWLPLPSPSPSLPSVPGSLKV